MKPLNFVVTEIQLFCRAFENDPKGCGLFIRRQEPGIYLIVRKGVSGEKFLVKEGAGYKWVRVSHAYPNSTPGVEGHNDVYPTLEAAKAIADLVYGTTNEPE